MQVLAALWRPSVRSGLRRVWNVLHWYAGRLAVAIAIGNLYYGMYLYPASTNYFIALSVVLGAIVLFLVRS